MGTIKVVKVLLLIGLLLPVLSSAEIWRYYPEGDLNPDMRWNLPADNDYYVQAYDPADFGIGSSPYKITEIGVNTYGDGIEGSGNVAFHLILLPSKDASPEGLPYVYDLTGQTLTWEDGNTVLNTYEVAWNVDADQCIGLVVIGEDPYIEDFIVIMDNGPADTSNWEYYLDGWYHVLDDFEYDYDFAFQLDVEDATAIKPASFGQIKAGFH